MPFARRSWRKNFKRAYIPGTLPLHELLLVTLPQQYYVRGEELRFGFPTNSRRLKVHNDLCIERAGVIEYHLAVTEGMVGEESKCITYSRALRQMTVEAGLYAPLQNEIVSGERFANSLYKIVCMWVVVHEMKILLGAGGPTDEEVESILQPLREYMMVGKVFAIPPGY